MSRTRLLEDLQAGVLLILGSVLLAAPAGLLWSAVAPRAVVTVTAQGPEIADIESNKAFVGADGSYFLVMLGFGLVCGVVGWWLFRRSGPFTVVALVIGGSAAALIASAVGLMPGANEAIDAVSEGSAFRGNVDLYLGRLQENQLALRGAWAFVGWPVGACLAFLVAGTVRPDGMD